ncbi:hypothetical protein EDB83DRAFT_2322429 [Lactarius deliciosus]|nr:hypothetical protein EDB83DRAFT_2322429 [Lactarius deliciosus]
MHARCPVRRVGATRASARSGNTKEHYIRTPPRSSARRFAALAWCARLSVAAPTSRGGSAEVRGGEAARVRAQQDWRSLKDFQPMSAAEPNDALLLAPLTEYWDKSGLLCIIVKQDDDDDPIADVSAASHGDPPLTHAEELTKPTHYISGGLSLDHHLLYADMLDGWRWHEFGVTGPTAEAALTSMESCNHRS